MKTAALRLCMAAASAIMACAANTSSGSIVLSPAGILFVVNPDSGTISAVDTRTRSRIAEIPVGEDPRMLALTPDARYLLVTCQGSSTLSMLDTGRLAVAARIGVDYRPYAVVVSPDGRFAYVASSAASLVDVVEISPRPPFPPRRAPVPSRLRLVSRIPVDALPKGLALSADGARLYVTHFLTGGVSVIDTASLRVVRLISTGADSNMAQKIALNPANGMAYLPHIRSNTPNLALLFDSTVFPVISVVDPVLGGAVAAQRVDLSLGERSVNLPFDIAFSPDGRLAYTVNFGSGDLSVVDLNAKRRIADVDAGDGPRGLAISPDGFTAYVANSLSDTVSVVDLASLREIQRISVTASPLDPVVKRGKTLFFSSRSPQIATQRWMSCGSCHFDAEIDGRTWTFAGSGPRNTTTLFGSGQTRPLHWSADRDEFQDFEFTIRQLQGGSGLITGREPNPPLGPPNAGLSADLDALAAFCASLAPAPGPPSADTASVQRGAVIFQRLDVGCARCHVPPRYTDSSLGAAKFVLHDVGTAGPLEQNGPAFDTPSLHMLWSTAPYLHDGSAPALLDVLTTRNRGDLHGRTSLLSASEISDLIAFLLSL
jgi:YVTN family beta-propeller protein